MSSHLRAEDHPTTRVIPEPSQRSRAGRLPPPRGDPAAEHYSRPIFWRETYYSLFPRELKVLRKKVVNSILRPAPFSNTSANALLIALDPFL